MAFEQSRAIGGDEPTDFGVGIFFAEEVEDGEGVGDVAQRAGFDEKDAGGLGEGSGHLSWDYRNSLSNAAMFRDKVNQAVTIEESLICVLSLFHSSHGEEQCFPTIHQGS